MNQPSPLIPFSIAAVGTGFVAIWLMGFIEQSGCVNAGGVYRASRDICEVASSSDYVLLKDRAGFWYWLLVFGPAVAVGTVVFTVLRRILQRNLTRSA